MENTNIERTYLTWRHLEVNQLRILVAARIDRDSLGIVFVDQVSSAILRTRRAECSIRKLSIASVAVWSLF